MRYIYMFIYLESQRDGQEAAFPQPAYNGARPPSPLETPLLMVLVLSRV